MTSKTTPKKIKKQKLHIAWTCDDGPTVFTEKMRDIFKNTLKKNPIPVTWFIQYDNLVVRKRVSFYKKLQNKEHHEIAIHGVSAITNHIHWFPTDNKKHTGYVSIQKALLAIKAFNLYLKKKGLKAKFVRAPTGLHSELMAYLRKLKKNADSISRIIIDESVKVNKKTSKAVRKTVVSFQALKAGLGTQKLHLWGGRKDAKISVQSWEVESAPKNHKHRIDSLKEKFISKALKDGKDHSLVILCHDNEKGDLTAVKKDILMIDNYATINNIDVIYYTMSDLYRKVTGKVP